MVQDVVGSAVRSVALPHVEVSLTKTPIPKLLLVGQATCIAALPLTVCECANEKQHCKAFWVVIRENSAI